jgi:hypothetical protein
MTKPIDKLEAAQKEIQDTGDLCIRVWFCADELPELLTMHGMDSERFTAEEIAAAVKRANEWQCGLEAGVRSEYDNAATFVLRGLIELLEEMFGKAADARERAAGAVPIPCKDCGSPLSFNPNASDPMAVAASVTCDNPECRIIKAATVGKNN